MPPSIVKTPGPTPSSASIAQKISTPKSKYNLRTRLFNNQVPKVEDEVKEKNFLKIYFYYFEIFRKNLKQRNRYEYANKLNIHFDILYIYYS
jgi:hypothetical protein